MNKYGYNDFIDNKFVEEVTDSSDKNRFAGSNTGSNANGSSEEKKNNTDIDTVIDTD